MFEQHKYEVNEIEDDTATVSFDRESQITVMFCCPGFRIAGLPASVNREEFGTQLSIALGALAAMRDMIDEAKE
jgi:hypothetical protein